MTKWMRSPILAGLFFVLCQTYNSFLYAQGNQKIRVAEDETSFVAKRHFSITLLPVIAASKASFQGHQQKYRIESAPQLSFEALINYHYNFEKHFSLIFGLGGGVIGQNFDYFIPKEMFNPLPGYDVVTNTAVSREKELFYIRVPVELERIWGSRSRNYWNTNLGLSILFSPQTEVESISSILLQNGQNYQYLEVNQDNNNYGKPWLNYHAAGGYTWLLRRNSIRANLKLNVSFTEFGSATYRFTFPNKPADVGRYGVNGSYLGLAISYIFSGRIGRGF